MIAGNATVTSRENAIRRIFRIGLFVKAAHSVLELVAAFALYAVPEAAIVDFTQRLTRHELLEDPRDLVANFLLRSAEGLSMNQKAAAALYLLTHGAVKLFLVIMVLRDKAWAYPLFMIALTLLIAYQAYQLSLGFSTWLAALTVFDLIVLALTWHEYRLHRASVGGA